MSLRIGIIGTNFISDWFVNASKAVLGVEATSVYSRSAQRGAEFRERHGEMKSFSDLSCMLGSDIDAVYIASPIFMHCEQAKLAIEAGKHVLCEKMMCADYQSAVSLAELAKARGVVLCEAMRPAFDPAFSGLRSQLCKIGRVREVHFEFCQYSSRYDRFKAGEVLNAFNPEIGNSALSDIGIYPLHMLVSLFGIPKDVKAEATILENGFEGEGRLTLSYEGMNATVSYSKIRGTNTASVIYGELGEIHVDRISSPTKITIIKDGGEQILDYCTEGTEIPGYNMRYEIAAFRDMVEGKIDYHPYLDTTLASVRIVDAAYRQTGAYKHMTKIEAYNKV